MQDFSCTIKTGEKVALIGANGAGKSTLIKCIANNHEGVRISPNNTIGYFEQGCANLNQSNTILQSVMENSVLPEHMARIVLARLGIRKKDVYKKIKTLSGGERAKVSLSALMCMECSILLLDEPTSFFDIYVIEALEQMLLDFDGTLILISHDRYLEML